MYPGLWLRLEFMLVGLLRLLVVELGVRVRVRVTFSIRCAYIRVYETRVSE